MICFSEISIPDQITIFIEKFKNLNPSPSILQKSTGDPIMILLLLRTGILFG